MINYIAAMCIIHSNFKTKILWLMNVASIAEKNIDDRYMYL